MAQLPPLIFLGPEEQELVEFLDAIKDFHPVKKLNEIIAFVEANDLQ